MTFIVTTGLPGGDGRSLLNLNTLTTFHLRLYPVVNSNVCLPPCIFLSLLSFSTHPLPLCVPFTAALINILFYVFYFLPLMMPLLLL